MELEKTIQERRSYRSLEPAEITNELVRELASAASLAPSCYNNQPWRFVFIYDAEMLGKIRETLSKGNEWARKGSMIIAVIGKKEDDCVIGERTYYQFDIGMATGFLLLKATELGLVAHPIAGYSPKKVRVVLGVPGEFEVITLLIVGKKHEGLEGLSEQQVENEKTRPERLCFEKFAYLNRMG
ncbi:MAG: nitroreductase family protein [Candidatus Micrarchaeota archaeon]